MCLKCHTAESSPLPHAAGAWLQFPYRTVLLLRCPMVCCCWRHAGTVQQLTQQVWVLSATVTAQAGCGGGQIFYVITYSTSRGQQQEEATITQLLAPPLLAALWYCHIRSSAKMLRLALSVVVIISAGGHGLAWCVIVRVQAAARPVHGALQCASVCADCCCERDTHCLPAAQEAPHRLLAC